MSNNERLYLTGHQLLNIPELFNDLKFGVDVTNIDPLMDLNHDQLHTMIVKWNKKSGGQAYGSK